MIVIRRLYLALALFVLLVLCHSSSSGQVYGESGVLESTSSSEIDTYSVTEIAYSSASNYYVKVYGTLYDGYTIVKTGDERSNVRAYVSLSTTAVHQGDVYTIYSDHSLIAVYYNSGTNEYTNPEGYQSGVNYSGGDYPGSSYSFSSGGGPVYIQQEEIDLGYTYYQFSTAPPHVASITPPSVARGSSGTFSLTGTELVDDLNDPITVHSLDGDDLSVAYAEKTSASLKYTIRDDANLGTHRFTVSTRWGETEPISFTVHIPPATITGISPNPWTAGQSNIVVQITGTNFGSAPSVVLSDPTIDDGGGATYNTSTTNGVSTTYINLSIPATTPSEPVVLTLIPGPYTQVSGGPPLAASGTATVIGAQQNACPDMLGTDGHAGFLNILSAGTPGGSGTITLTFSNGSFNGFGVTVPYGQFSTRESIAAHIAALITKNYYNQGLSAQAVGSQIIYQGIAPAGIANVTSSGSSGSSPSFSSEAPFKCPAVNANFALIVTYDSGTWVANSRGGVGVGRDVSYELSKWTRGNYNVNRPPMISSLTSEHLSKPMPDGSYGTTSPDLGAFCDLLGSTGGPSLTGIYDPERYFTVVYTDPQHVTHDLGSVRILDKSGEHSTDKIVVNFPSGPTILNSFDKDHLLSYPQTLRLTKGPCGH